MLTVIGAGGGLIVLAGVLMWLDYRRLCRRDEELRRFIERAEAPGER